jgi:hypothetical protein
VLAARAAEDTAVEAVQDPQKSPLVVFKVQLVLPICCMADAKWCV